MSTIRLKAPRSSRISGSSSRSAPAASVDPSLEDEQSAQERFAQQWLTQNPGRVKANGRVVPWTPEERAAHLARLQSSYAASGMDPEALAGPNLNPVAPSASRTRDADGGRSGLTSGGLNDGATKVGQPNVGAPPKTLRQATTPTGYAMPDGSRIGGGAGGDTPSAQAFPVSTPSPGVNAMGPRGVTTFGKVSQSPAAAPLPPGASVSVPDLNDGKPMGIYRDGKLAYQDPEQRAASAMKSPLDDTAAPTPGKATDPLPDDGDIDPLTGKPKRRGGYAGPRTMVA